MACKDPKAPLPRGFFDGLSRVFAGALGVGLHLYDAYNAGKIVSLFV